MYQLDHPSTTRSGFPFSLKTHDSFLDMLQLVDQMGSEWSLRDLVRFFECDERQVWACHVSRSDFESLGTCAACEKWSASHGSCSVKDQLASVNYCSAACPLVLASRVGLHVPTRHGGAAILHVIQVSHVIGTSF